jgi:hypothetical protein
MISLDKDAAATTHAQDLSRQQHFEPHLSTALDTQSAWAVERVDSERTPTETDLVLDSHGYPHIVYGGDRLCYTWFDGTTWHDEIIDLTWGTGKGVSIALDRFDRPHIAYSDSVSWTLRYARYDGTDWQITTIGGLDGPPVSLALDSNDVPHITYASLGGLRYAWFESGSWLTTTVDSNTYAYFNSLVMHEGAPHVAYMSGYSLKYAWISGTTWFSETVDPNTEWNLSPSLIMSDGGIPHISYYDVSPSEELRYTWLSDTTWLSTTVDAGLGSSGGGTSLELDSTGNPHVTYHGAQVRYAHLSGGDWITTSLGIGRHAALELDGNDQPHISYIDWYDLFYSHRENSNWESEKLDTGGAVDWSTSLALDASGTPHIAYAKDSHVKYAWLSGTTWLSTTVDGVWGDHPSLVFSSENVPHLSYHGGATDLIYAWLDGSMWVSTTVDSHGNVGYYNSLALDSNDDPFISYGGWTDSDLKFAWQQRTDIVSTTGGTVFANGIAELEFPPDTFTDTVVLTYLHHRPARRRPTPYRRLLRYHRRLLVDWPARSAGPRRDLHHHRQLRRDDASVQRRRDPAGPLHPGRFRMGPGTDLSGRCRSQHHLGNAGPLQPVGDPMESRDLSAGRITPALAVPRTRNAR